MQIAQRSQTGLGFDITPYCNLSGWRGFVTMFPDQAEKLISQRIILSMASAGRSGIFGITSAKRGRSVNFATAHKIQMQVTAVAHPRNQ